MSKIICDICGTSYPETAECCPICGCTKDSAAVLLSEDMVEEEILEETVEKAGKFSSKKKKEIFDFDEVNADKVDREDEQNPYEDDDEDFEEAPRTSIGWIIVLTLLIVALLAAAGFIFMRFIRPNLDGFAPAETTQAVVETYEAEETQPTQEVRCQDLIMTSGKVAELNTQGQYFMLHVIASPADTTDKIVYESSDESIVTVTEDGKLTAVSEGEATIYITCGDFQLTCDVVCRFVEETLPPETEAAPVETEAVEESTGSTVPEETKAAEETKDSEATEPAEENKTETTEETKAPDTDKSGVKLKLKKTDISLAVYYQFTLELDCDLKPEDVEWKSEHSHIATVDEKGVVTAKKSGTTSIIAKYGDQEVQCIIRCYK